jgi:aspartyl-tRNA(Asn)/glutamyl-tRNA(Gln) amidotransferase subunit C
MSVISREELLKLASLARLKLTEEEINRLPDELSAILEYVRQLDKVDTGGLEPTYQVTGLKNVTRSDELREYQAKPAALLKNAPVVSDNQFKVKRVI